jgi:tetratricopeptide (TPR) repeat protein
MGRRREWVSAETQFKDMAARFDVDALDAPFAVLLSRASNGRQAELVERLCEFVLSEHRDKATIVARAASFWVIGSSERSQWPQVIERLNTLLDQGVPEGVLLNPFSKTIYAVVQSGAPESQQAMLDVGKRISKGELTEADQIRIKILMFDGAFLMDDYDAVLTALLEGVPERDEDWHEMAINKVSAHKALKEGNIDEAIKRFREFMEVTDRTWKDAQVDPSTRIRHSREMIMGFNARRIGNILKEAGRAEEAGKAYREAVDYYEAALEQAEPDSPEHRKIVSDLGEIPADSSTSIE